MPRKKQAGFNEEPEEKEEPFEWDKPRIIGFFAVLLFLLVGGLVFKHFLLDANTIPASQAVQGASTQANESLPSVQDIKQGAAQQVAALQQQASQISVQEIASSSPQVQQILQQIKQLPSVPGNVAKQTCMNICNSL